MKNYYLLAIAMCMCTMSHAQQYLIHMDTELLGEEHDYFYNNANQLDSISWIKDIEGMTTGGNYFEFDENGNLVRWNNYQFFDGQYTNTGYLLYEFDEEGNMTSRENYNRIAGEIYFQARIEYAYNGNGLLDTEITYMEDWDTGELTPTSKSVYYYNNGNLLDSIVTYSNDIFMGIKDLVLSGKTIYTYDEEERYETIEYYEVMTAGTDLLSAMQREQYEYDENGNLTLLKTDLGQGTSAYWTPYRENKYEYDLNTEAKDVVYPIEPEGMYYNYAMQISKNKLVKETDSGEFDGEWGIMGIMNYTYSNERPHRGIAETIASGEELSVYMNGNKLMINGIKENKTIRIYNIAGVMIMEKVCDNSGIDMTNIPSGMYCITANGKSAKLFK